MDPYLLTYILLIHHILIVEASGTEKLLIAYLNFANSGCPVLHLAASLRMPVLLADLWEYLQILFTGLGTNATTCNPSKSSSLFLLHYLTKQVNGHSAYT